MSKLESSRVGPNSTSCKEGQRVPTGVGGGGGGLKCAYCQGGQYMPTTGQD